jgi:hypothetical protein
MTTRGVRKYWVLTVHYVCPVCDRESIARERQYTMKPEDPRDRHSWEVSYDWCDAR